MTAFSRELDHRGRAHANAQHEEDQMDNVQMHPQPCQEGNEMHMMFEELNDYFEEELQGRHHKENDNNNEEQQHENVINAELLQYKQEPSIRISKEDGSKFNCRLTWWRVNQLKFPIIAHLAQGLRCIPATSALSEHVFSSAGLTMAKDCARLAPETANELVFLHEALPVVRKFEGDQRRMLRHFGGRAGAVFAAGTVAGSS
jgi:hypothetical protein